jgi:hypothetical protein
VACAASAGLIPANPKLALGLTQQQQTAVRGLAAALEINCELLAMNGWQVEPEGLIVVHGGVALAWDAKHFVWTTNCYSIPTTCATPLSPFHKPDA